MTGSQLAKEMLLGPCACGKYQKALPQVPVERERVTQQMTVGGGVVIKTKCMMRCTACDTEHEAISIERSMVVAAEGKGHTPVQRVRS